MSDSESEMDEGQIQPIAGPTIQCKILGNMFKHFVAGEFCDITLKAGKDKKRFQVHRVVMSAASEYFSALFKNEMKEKYANEILLNDIDGATLRNLIEYCYRGEIGLNEGNVDDILSAAHMLRFTELKQQCTDYYENFLNCTNCLGVWATAKLYGFDTVIGLASSFAFENFMEVVNCDEFKYMEFELLSEFLSNDNVNVDSEEKVCRALVVWLKFDFTKRMPHMQRLIEAIRVGQLNRSFVDGDLLVWCQMINDLHLYESILIRHCMEQSTARSSTAFGRLFVIGGSTWDNENGCFSVQRYCPVSNKWKHAHSFPGYRELFGSIEYNNQLIIIGGENMLDISLETVVCLDLKNLTTKKLKPMKIARSMLSIAFAEGCIYAIGGTNEGTVLRSTERYDVQLNQWTEVASMTKKRAYAASAVLSGAIFATGGEDDDEVYDSVECYVPGLNVWFPVAPMNMKRKHHQAGVANNILYVYGGYDGVETFDTLEKYDPLNNKWTLLTFKLQIPRSSFGSAIFKDWLFVMGGEDDEGTRLNSMEKINLTTGASVLLDPTIFENSFSTVVHFVAIDPHTNCQH